MLTKGMLTLCNNSFAHWGGFKIVSEDALREMIENDPQLVADLKESYSAATDDTDDDLDTYDRDGLFDLFAQKSLGLDGWPMNMSAPEESDKFMAAIEVLARNKVIEIVPE